MTSDDICVIIPVLNEAAGIAAAIESVSDAGQIIVVDGGSNDATVAIGKSFAHVTIVGSRPGRGQQLAMGLCQCDRKVVLFLHGDCQLSRHALIQVSDAVNRGYSWGALQQHVTARGMAYRMLELGNAARVRYRGIAFGDQAMFAVTELVREVGGVEAIQLLEDLRLSRRLRRRRWPVLLDATVMVSPRRWEKRGIFTQTAINWSIQALHAAGVSPNRLAKLYR